MAHTAASPVVHIELQTGNLSRACAFYTRLLGWRVERIPVGDGSYVALGLGRSLEGGVVESDTEHSLWLPYAEVDDVTDVTERARRLGATVLLEPREGPAGWRSILEIPSGAEIALWQPKA